MYPTPEHEACAQLVCDFFAHQSGVQAITLICSCATGMASPASDVDMHIILSPTACASSQKADLESQWATYFAAEPAFSTLAQHGPYAHVEVDLSTAKFAPQSRGWTSGPDDFELEVGNYVAYAQPLWEKEGAFQKLQAQWLPYYDEALRQDRLAETLKFCHNNLDHIQPFIARGLYFQAFHRFYDAYREFLQALFMARRTYPIAYDKWIKKQLVDILGLPELYPQVVGLLEIKNLESDELLGNLTA